MDADHVGVESEAAIGPLGLGGLTSTTSPEIGGYLDTHPRVRLLTYQSTLTSRMLIDAGFGAYQSPFGPRESPGNTTRPLARMIEQCAAGCSANGGLPGMTEVQYKGSTPAHPDLIANRITFMIDPLAAASPHIRSGLLRALAVSTPQRNPAFPDVPAAAEILPGYDFASWGGVFAPAGTPRAVVMSHE